MSTTKTVTVNDEQKLFVIPSGDGYSCLGFTVCENRRKRYAKWLGCPLSPATIGSIEQYNSYDDLIKRICSRCLTENIRCDADLCPQLTGLEGKRVEVVTHYDEKRRFYVSRSTGPMQIHLEISTRRSTGGNAADESGYKSVRVIGNR